MTQGILSVTSGTRAPANWTTEEPAANRTLATKAQPTGLIERWDGRGSNKLHCYQGFFEGGFAHGRHAQSLTPGIVMTRAPNVDAYNGKAGTMFISLDSKNVRACARPSADEFAAQAIAFADAALDRRASTLSKQLGVLPEQVSVEIRTNERRTIVAWSTARHPNEAAIEALGFTKGDISRREPCTGSTYDILEPLPVD